ncbi:DUF600 domain-containing protein [Rossellomorea vietnamensis]|uniref:DUF600 domain-containing protein n=1 Tax=Rossellomorea vietnamensis TaxID=218284 RepID=UPI001E40AAA0|nr:DUF600 domain-containing protein [Rossellomorea vietnamensis]MCC5803737.1 DUF600 domain-containing protein [Rossellomorea vietnamensis]
MKDFEDRFSELQADMISICMEYIEDRADKVYVYCSSEKGIISANFFYLIDNMYLEPHMVNESMKDGTEAFDITPKRQSMVLRIICEDIQKINTLCKEYERDMPTEMKLIYEVKSGNFKAEYKYDLVYANDDIKTADHIADEWFEEIKNNNL